MEFGEINEVPLREVWRHESRDFTPWLAGNLDRLSAAIGVPIEPEDTEVAVEQFSADIVAHNPANGTRLLIANQLEGSDHTHLGQLLTYLAGVQAQTIVWVASKFEDAHRSAIRWLNDHTAEPFAFFAVQVRVVRIGDSPMVPVFEVLERPSKWDRSVRDMFGQSDLTRFRRDFWAFYSQRHPDGKLLPTDGYAASSFWVPIESAELNLAPYVSRGGVGIWVRGRRGEETEEVRNRLAQRETSLREKLGVTVGAGTSWGSFADSVYSVDDGTNPKNWPAMADWIHETIEKYFQALGGDAMSPNN